jgi:hypothetical protein
MKGNRMKTNVLTIRRRMARNYAKLLRELAAMDRTLGALVKD